MRTAVIIGYVWPEPRSSAAGYHMLSLISLLQTHQWRVVFASPAELSSHRFDLPSIGVEEVQIALNCSSFDAWIKTQAPNLVLFDRFMMEEQFGWRVASACPNALRVLDTEDLHSLRKARHQILKRQLKASCYQPNALQDTEQLYTEMAQQDETLREVAAIQRCDLTLMISDIEFTLLTERMGVPNSHLLYCPFMPAAASPEQWPDFAQRNHFVSIGNFRHAPNWDAVLWLKETIWPGIRKQMPDAQLHIYGAYPPPKATALHNPAQGFLVKGWADDAHQVLRQARVLLAPLRFGAGIKGKLLDAMLNGTPSITTPMGIEGMSATTAAWPGSVAETAQGLIDEAVALYQHPEHWQAAQAKINPLLNERFDTASTAERLIARITQLLTDNHLAEHRLSNLTGLMLNHHHHKSTQYMSQWIEAKNAHKA